MNYIPGFSNYLQTSVPRYAIGGRVMDGERMMYDEPMMYDMGGYNEMPYGGGGMLPAPVEQPYQQAAVEPMTQEAVSAEAPFDPNTFDFSKLDLSGLNSLYGMNFGSNFGGGAMGGIYPNDPNLQYIGAPLSNKGNATGKSAGNTFTMTPDQPVRLVDLRTNTIVFEGTGFDAAREATRLGQSMTDSLGRKANYDIQTANPAGVYTTVANEKKNKSTLGTIANVAGTVLPLAMMAIPGVNAALLGANFAKTLGGQLAFGALTGGASSALKGQNVLKGAALGGLTAAGGALIPKIPAIGDLGNLARPIGTGIGATVGGLATGQSLKNSLLGGVASGALAYAAPSIQESLGIGQGPNVSAGGDTSTGFGGPNADIIVNATPSFTPGINLGGYQTPAQKYVKDAALDDVRNPETNAPYNSGYDGDLINVTAQVPTSSNINFSGGNIGLPPMRASGLDAVAEPTPEEILVNAREAFTPPVNIDLSNVPTGGLNAVTTPEPTPEEILVKARETFNSPVNVVPTTAPTGGLNTVTEPTPEEILVKARETATSAVPVTGGNLDQTITPEYLPKEDIVVKGRETLTPAVPVTGGLTLADTVLSDIDKKAAEEAEAKKKKLGLEEYLRIAGLLSGLVGGAAGGGGSGQTGTYGGGGTGRLNPIFSAKLPSAGGLGTIGATRTARPLGDQDWLTYGTRPELNFFDYASQNNPAPITTPIPNNPAGPAMYAPDVDNMRFAKGGRSTFAVNGPGTGRSDDIPAVLSDGEYVIDAETVALLGDGSNKAGAKKLDDLRVKVRKHKGQKLAKGRFSANAKKAEAYLSGGRI